MCVVRAAAAVSAAKASAMVVVVVVAAAVAVDVMATVRRAKARMPANHASRAQRVRAAVNAVSAVQEAVANAAKHALRATTCRRQMPH
jgi:anti-sigma regulatory factor (Ser/Thr protein kinase)